MFDKQKLSWPIIMAFLSLILTLFWFILVLYAAPKFQEIVGTDPLAMINVLFPYYWIIILGYLGICLYSFFKPENPGWLYMLLVAQISLLLFFTPFILSGFSWSPDSLWHGGVARYIPEILSGSNLEFSQYAQSYPLSFISTYFAINFVWINLYSYTLYIYPFFTCILISVLAYFFAARIFGNKVGFLSILLTLPAWHYFEPHVSPFSAGTILILSALILLTYKNPLTSILSYLAFFLVVFTHPISPLSLGVVIFAYLIVGYIFKNPYGRNLLSTRRSSIVLLFLLIVTWTSWTIYHSIMTYPGLEKTLLSVFNLSFFSRTLRVSEFTVGGEAFIYPEIHSLSLVVYGIFLILALIPFLEYLKNKLTNKEIVEETSILSDKMALSLAAIFNAIMGFLLFLSSGERFLLGRGLLYFIFFGSMVFATYLVNYHQISKKIRTTIILVLIISLFCSFPVISYSKEAYNSFTPSSGSGLTFLTSNIELSNKSISIGAHQQLAAYLDLTKNYTFFGFPPNLTSHPPDVIVMRLNTYYVIAMRYDLSFTNNRYTNLEEQLNTNSTYNKVYSNPKFQIYLNSP